MKKNEFKNLIKKVVPVILCLLWFGAIVLGLVLVYKDYQSKIVHSANTSMNLLCASADATDTVDETSLDVTQYPSANLLDVSIIPNDDVFIKNEDNSFTITKISNDLRMSARGNISLKAGSYCFSYNQIDTNIVFDSETFAHLLSIRFLDSSGVVQGSLIFNSENFATPVSLVINADVVKIQIYLQKSVPDNSYITFSNVMLNAGETAYPYIPPFNSIYQDGYNAGYDVGETDGKDIGYNDGYDQGYADGEVAHKYGVFSKENYAEFGLIENGKTGVTYIDISPTFENGIANFRTVSHFCQSYYPDFGGLYRFSFVPLDNVRLRDFRFKITLLDPASFDITTEYFEYMAVVYTKSSQSFQVSLVKDPLDNSLFCRIMDTDRSNIEKMGWDDTITKIEFTFNNVNDLLFTLTDLTAHTPYEVGYDNGVISGKEIGYDEGYDVGLNDGIEQGQSEDPYGLDDMFFGILDAPFNVIRNALNFEILGINISSFVLFIITAFIVLFVIKKIGGK